MVNRELHQTEGFIRNLNNPPPPHPMFFFVFTELIPAQVINKLVPAIK